MRSSVSKAEFVLLRRPAFAGLVALALGLALGPMGLHVLRPQLFDDGAPVESVSEIALLVCLFCSGLRLRTPIEWQFWRTPVRLSTLTMLATAGLIAAAAHLMFDMSFAQSLLLGTVLAPTDLPLPADVAAHSDIDPQAPTVVLATEAGLNNGLASTLVMVALALMGLSDMEPAGQTVSAVNTIWTTVAGFAVGWLVAAGTASWMRTLDPARQADLLEEMMVFATAALAYGGALALHANGFIAVFTAGVALSHGGRLRRPMRNRPLMPRVLKSALKVERLAWLGVTVLLGALLTQVELRPTVLIFAALLIPIRALAVRLGLGGLEMSGSQWRGVAWCMARGTASLYWLAFAINHGLEPRYARELATITLVVLAASVISSAISALPLRGATAGTVDL